MHCFHKMMFEWIFSDIKMLVLSEDDTEKRWLTPLFLHKPQNTLCKCSLLLLLVCAVCLTLCMLWQSVGKRISFRKFREYYNFSLCKKHMNKTILLYTLRSSPCVCCSVFLSDYDEICHSWYVHFLFCNESRDVKLSKVLQEKCRGNWPTKREDHEFAQLRNVGLYFPALKLVELNQDRGVSLLFSVIPSTNFKKLKPRKTLENNIWTALGLK